MIIMKPLKQEKGFTIVEAIVAQVILVLGALCVWNIFIAGTRFNAESEDRTIATNIAQLQTERIMNTRFRYIVSEHPSGETYFEEEPQYEPFWTLSSGDKWTPSLSEGRYRISYPDGEDADPLRIMVTVLWEGHLGRESSVILETLVSMTPGRFRG